MRVGGQYKRIGTALGDSQIPQSVRASVTISLLVALGFFWLAVGQTYYSAAGNGIPGADLVVILVILIAIAASLVVGADRLVARRKSTILVIGMCVAIAWWVTHDAMNGPIGGGVSVSIVGVIFLLPAVAAVVLLLLPSSRRWLRIDQTSGVESQTAMTTVP